MKKFFALRPGVTKNQLIKFEINIEATIHIYISK